MLPSFLHNASLLAQSASEAAATTSTSLELDWPETAWEWSLFIGYGLAAVFVVWMYLRDTRGLSGAWTIWLSGLRLALVAALIVIAVNPQERTQKDAFRPSQVAILVDTSTSMQQPADDRQSIGTGERRTRIQAAQELLTRTQLIEQLRRTHHVDLYTFDSDLSESLYRFETDYDPRGPAVQKPAETPDSADPVRAPKWSEWLQARGESTRLGDALEKLLAEVRGKTLSGVIVISDGASNTGRDIKPAIDRARLAGVRLISVGVGGTQPPLNLQIARVVAPTDVQLPHADMAEDGQDTFEITVYVQSQGLAGRTATVELLRQYADEEEPTVVATQEVTLPEGPEPIVATFAQTAEQKGAVDYTVRVQPPAGIRESRDDDNLQTRTINVFDEPLKILIVAGGPMRDYIFAKNVLHRHNSMQVDVWLQTGGPGISQDAHDILYEFPKTREELFGYDVVIAFDPDWSQIPVEGQELLEQWVESEGGGLILISGDVNTPQLAAAISDAEDGANHLANLYPVLLEEVRYGLGSDEGGTDPFPIALTQEGQAAAFLKLEEQPGETDVWDEFQVYRCYPTRGRKRGATVYAEFTDPQSRGRDGQPVLLAGQRYSQGSVLYLGSPETWRLRGIDEQYYDRFWIKFVRKAAEGRTKRGVQGSMLIMEGREYNVGQTVPVRARLLNSQFEPLDDQHVTLQVYDPTGKPLVPALELERDANRPAEYTGGFLAALPGRYKLELQVPDSREVITADVMVSLPALEMAELRQNVNLLRQLAEGTGGAYLSLDEAAAQIPDLLPNMGQQIIIDQQLRELWDRQWVLFLLVGLLATEWLTRKLLKLA